MMILLTPQDWAKLSEEAKAEIIDLMINRDIQDSSIDFAQADYNPVPPIKIEEFENQFPPPPQHETWPEEIKESNLSKKKIVLEIDETQASELISNLSDKSLQTLKLFSEDEPVSIDSLIGKGNPYKDYVELKRSFVGPVNRRLRTVSRNKAAVLFLKVSGDDSNAQISVKKGSMMALRSAFQNSGKQK